MSNAENDGYETYNPEYSKKGTKTYSTLSNKNSTITYTVQITNTTGAKYTVSSIEISNTNSNVSCTPNITKGSIIEAGISDFTIEVKYNGTDSLTESIEDVCEIKYEFIPLDTTSPVLVVETISQENKTAKLKITATDEDGGSGLSTDNIYKYCLSTSSEEAKECTWTNYISGEEFEVTAPSNGEYYLLVYSIGDKAGNISDGKESIGEATNKLCLPLFNKITDFEYTGNEQTYIVPTDGYYKIEAWGAQGSDYGGNGSYTTGIIELKKNTVLYVIVGGINGYNGGNGNDPKGGELSSDNTTSGSIKYGGGATDIRLTHGDNILESTSLNSRIMVAGGGGSVTNNDSGAKAGIGGTLYGIEGISHLVVIGVENTGNVKYNGGGATQTSGGSGATGATSGEFGYGGNFGAYTDGHRGSYGGGGYYGGGGSTWHSGSGGGSSFISGYAGVNAIASVNDRTPTNNTLHYSGKYFIDSNMEEDINEGNGKAKITYISKEKPERKNKKLNGIRYIQDCTNGNSINVGSHWVELQAIYQGKNVAKGKTITAVSNVGTSYGTGTITSIVDGDIDSSQYSEFGESRQCITVDLGQAYDLDEITTWRYWIDKRTYYKHTTFVSQDNANWINITQPTIEESNNGDRISAYEEETEVSAYVIVNLLPDSSFELNQYNLSTSTKTNLTEGISVSTDFARNGWKSLMNYHSQQYASFYTGSIMDISAVPNDVYYARDWIYNIDLGQYDDNTKGISYIDLSFYYDSTDHWSPDDGEYKFSDGRLNSWHKVSIRRMAPSVNSKIVLAIGPTNSSNKQQHFYSDSVILLDLTKMFGSGNEPDIQWCNNNIPHIEGTKIIYLPKHSDYYTGIVDSNGGYRVNDGTYDLTMINAKNGDTQVITERRRNGYTLTGYTLTNVLTASTTDLGGASITFDPSTKQALYTQGMESVFITANWQANNYTLTVNPNGGILNGSTANRTYSMQYGETRGIANPTRDGYIFGGWTVSGTESSMNGTVFQMGTANATITAKWKSLKPSYTYTGQSQLIDDGNGNWRIKFITSGTLTFNDLGNGSSGVDIFLVGGGGGGGSTRTQTIRGSFGKHSNSWGTYDGAYINRNDGGGGGGGYTKTMTNISMAASTSYNIVIGAGGAAGSGDNASGSAGGTTQISNITDASVSGGSGGTYETGGNGGSGGGASAYHKQWTVIPCTKNKRACLSVSDEYTNATAGASNGGSSSGTGQGRTTREFGSSTGTLYAGGGGGGAENNTSGSNAAGGSGGGGAGHTAGAANTGGGGGGGSAGGSGIVIIRNHASSGTTGGVSYTYTGDSEFISDGGDNWRIKFLTSGTLTFSSLGTASSGIDLFLVGGGSAEGGGGYTATHKGLSIAKGTSYSIVVGSGGTSSSVNGGTSSGFGKSVNGGQGKDGGSGAGGSGYVNDGATGGTNGGNGGLGGDNWTGGTGQGTTTREFGESSGALYAGGGGGGLGSGCKACLPDSNGKMTVDKTSVGGAGGDSTAGNGEGYKGAASCTNGKTNTGGGAGLGKRGTAQCTGGSGVVIIRNKR